MATFGGRDLPPSSAHEGNGRTAGGGRLFKFDGMTFTVTEGNEVAQVGKGGAVHALGGESFVDAGTGTRKHFVDVQGKTEAMLLLVSVDEAERRIVDIRRFS